MPTIANMQILPPKGWDEFQDITTTALKARWRSPNLQQHGRLGQRQNGVDIYGADDLGRLIGVQCKLSTDELKDAEITGEVLLAEGFKPPLAAFYVATSGKRDAKIQATVRILSEQRVVAGKFGLGVIFWEDIVADLVANPQDLQTHYPQLVVADAPERAGFALLCALDLAYWGLGVKQLKDLIFHSGVPEDPLQIDKVLRSVEESARPLLARPEHQEIVGFSRSLVEACHGQKWDDADTLATKVEIAVTAAEYGLEGRRLAAYSLGRYLRVWDIATTADKTLSAPAIEAIVSAARSLAAGGSLPSDLKSAAEDYNANHESMNSVDAAHRAYNRVRGMLLHEGMQ